MTFKQEYICKNGPFPFDFGLERNEMFIKIQDRIKSCHPNQWNLRGISPLYYIQSMKQVYGITKEQLASFINYFLNLLKQPNMEADTMIIVMKILNNMREYKINVSKLIKTDNHFFLNSLQDIMEKGCKYQVKSIDSFMDEFMKIVRHFSQYGQDIIEEVLELAIKKRQNKFIALFIRCVKTEKNALKVMEKIFAESSLWDRESCFYFIISEITRKFPNINYSIYYETLFHETIKIMTTIIDPTTEEDIKKVVNPEVSLNLPPILKSIASILVNLLKPMSEPGWEVVWISIQRIFSLISSTLDHFRQTEYMNDFLMFLKQFVKSFTQRYRSERHMFEIVNEDYIQQFHGTPNEHLVITEQYFKLFNSLWPPIIPELLYLEDNDVRVARILYELILLSPENFLQFTLNQILKFLERDITIVSIFSTKMTVLLISQFIIKNYTEEHEMSLLIQCCTNLLVVMEKLGISEHLDILQLVMRCFLHFPEDSMDNILVQNLSDDIINIILNNMDAMSINLESNQSEEAELYIDLRNIYFPFIVRLSQSQILELSDKILFKIKNCIPQHRQAYQFITVALCYVNKNLPKKILDFVFKQIIGEDPQKQHIKRENSQTISPYSILPSHPEYFLNISNEQHIRWYCSIVQCAFQYHPQNLIDEWPKLQKIVLAMLRQWQKSNILDWGLDLLFNLVINLCNVHLACSQFKKKQNCKYETLKQMGWEQTTPEQRSLIFHIKTIFYDNLQAFIHQRYDHIHNNSETVKKLNSSEIISIESNNKLSNIEVSIAANVVVDSLMSSQAIPTLEDLNEKTIIYKILSIQYTVFSAFQERAPYTNEFQQIQGIKSFFIPEMPCVRAQAIVYLKYIKQLLCHYNILADTNLLKTYHFFWREAHDEIFFSSAIISSNQKLQPHYHPHLHRKKELFSNSFLIISEIYISTMLRVELHCSLKPIAYLNDKNYLKDIIPLIFSPALDTTFKSTVPDCIDIHKQFHHPIIDTSRIKFHKTHQASYNFKYSQSEDNTEKERYLQSIRNIILGIKRNQMIFVFGCCYREQALWAEVIQMLEFYPCLEKKADKAIIIDIIYLIIIFAVDSKGSLMYPQGQDELRARKFQENLELINYLLVHFSQSLSKKMQKNTLLMGILLLCFQQYIPITHPVHLEIFSLAVQLCSGNGQHDQNNLGKTLLFRYINRTLKAKVIKENIINSPIKRSFEEYLKYRNLGGLLKEGTMELHESIKTDKVDNYFYPLKQLQKVSILPMNQEVPLQKMISQFLENEEEQAEVFKSFRFDLDLKISDGNEDLVLDIDEPKKVSHNGHKIMNYIFDSNPQKLDIFSSFIDNFVNYPTLFYHKLYRKMFLLGSERTRAICKKLVIQDYDNCEKQEKKLRQFVMVELLPYLIEDQQYIQFFANQLVNCSNEEFNRINNCLLVIFCIDWRINKKMYPKIVKHLYQAKGRIQLRVLEVLNNFILCTGRFGRQFAVEGIENMLKGIQQGTDQVAELIVSMLISCFIIPINLQILGEWVEEPVSKLLQENKISRITQTAGYEIDSSLVQFLDKVIAQCEKQKNLSSKNLKTYSKIANKILSSITVYRFNDSFYNLLKTTIMYFLNKMPSSISGMPSTDEEVNYDEDIVAQLKQSEYPENIYEDIMKQVLESMDNDKISVIKKKLKYLEGITINRCFVTGKIKIPPLFGASCPETNGKGKNRKQNCKQELQKEKTIYIEHIIAISNIARICRAQELSQEVECVLHKKTDMKNIHMMMALLLAAGTRQFQWRQILLNQIIQHKKSKLVKEFISYWWKGRSPETEEEQRLYMLVRSVENPYTYFA